MSRKKFRRSQRKEPSNEISYQEYILNQPAPPTSRTELIRLIRGGEDTYLELKVKLSNPERIAQEIIALANTDGGVMIFGVTDQLRVQGVRSPENVQEELVRICRKEISPPIVPLLDTIAFDNGKRIVVLDVENSRRPYCTRDGRFYLRIGAEKREATREELSALLGESRPLRFENVPISEAIEEDFDDALLWSFADGFDDEILGRNQYQTKDFLKKDLLLAFGNENNFSPTVASILLFGKNERVDKLIPRSGLTVVRYAGETQNSEIIEKIKLEGNLLTLYESALKFIERYCDLLKFKPKKKKKDSADDPVASRKRYHLYSILEGLINALIHRDLALRDGETQVLIFDDSIEFINPRRTNGFVPPASKAIRYGITQRVNPQIASIFTRREYGINAPRGGLPMIIRQSYLFSDKRVEVYTTNDRFRLKIHGK